MSMTKTKWFLPGFCVVLGFAVMTAQWIGGSLRDGLVSLALLSGFGLVILNRPAIQTLGVDIAVDQFDHRHVGGVSITNASFQHPAIAARAAFVTFRQRREQFRYDHIVAQPRMRQPAIRQPAFLAQCDQLLRHWAEFLRLGQRGRDLLMLQQSMRQVAKHRLTMSGCNAELTAGNPVTHGSIPLSRAP